MNPFNELHKLIDELTTRLHYLEYIDCTLEILEPDLHEQLRARYAQTQRKVPKELNDDQR